MSLKTAEETAWGTAEVAVPTLRELFTDNIVTYLQDNHDAESDEFDIQEEEDDLVGGCIFEPAMIAVIAIRQLVVIKPRSVVILDVTNKLACLDCAGDMLCWHCTQDFSKNLDSCPDGPGNPWQCEKTGLWFKKMYKD